MATNKTNYDYEEIILHFGKEKIIQRYQSLEEYLNIFINRSNYKDSVIISTSLLNQAVIDYFADMDRLKLFHDIKHANYIKIHAYTAYWLLRRRPIQIVRDNDEDIELAFVNENFVASYLMQYLRGDYRGVVIRKDDRANYNEFVENLKYVLRYRLVTPQTLETILLSYHAGRIFERSIGISDEFTQ